eukprot:scaffold6245_cov154-Chaetoceros_neogracile.AAC.1
MSLICHSCDMTLGAEHGLRPLVRSTADQERAARSAQSYQVVTGWSDRWILLSLHVAAVVNDM